MVCLVDTCLVPRRFTHNRLLNRLILALNRDIEVNHCFHF